MFTMIKVTLKCGTVKEFEAGISAAEITGTTSTNSGGAISVCAATSVTFAPRRIAACATAKPILPVE